MILSKPDLSEILSKNVVSRPNADAPVLDLVSITLHLGGNFIKYVPSLEPVVLPSPIQTEVVPVDADGMIDLPPGECILSSTEEIIDMPLDLIGFIQTKGTIARGFVTVQLCDGQIEPGFNGNITLELANIGPIHYRLRPGTPIAQLFFQRISTTLPEGYNGRYQGSVGPTSMRTSSDNVK